MTTQAELSVRRSITVNVGPQRAFDVFTTGFNTWWPRAHHIAPGDLDEAIIEPRVGGRWMERTTDGTECEWGKVLAWDPPRRVVLSWHLDGDWQLDPDPAHASEVEVTFTPQGGGTLVELTHRHIERARKGEQLAGGVSSEGGWGGLLALYAGKAV